MRSGIFILLAYVLAHATLHAQNQPLKNGKYLAEDSYNRTEGWVKKRMPDGRWVTSVRYLDDNGYISDWKVICIRHYKNGQLNGPYVRLTQNGDTISTGMYRNNHFTGEWRHYTGKQLTQVMQYDTSGQQVGWEYQYTPDGKLVCKKNYSRSFNCYSWTYTPEGNLCSRGAFTENGMEGTWYEYDNAENIKSPSDTLPTSVSVWHQGLLEGNMRKYVNGELVMETRYIAGRKDGDHYEYTKGATVLQEQYTAGLRNGLRVTWTVSKKKLTEENYLAGKKNGWQFVFDSTTQEKTEEWNYEAGLLLSMKKQTVGKVLLAEQRLVERDSLVYVTHEFYANGNKKSSGRLIGQKRTGSYEAWHENGKKRISTAFREDRYYGTTEIWNNKGVRVFRSQAFNGRDTLPEEIWSDAGTLLKSGTIAFEKQRAKYIPADLVAYYDEIVNVGQVEIISLPPRGPWQDYRLSILCAAWWERSAAFISPEYSGGQDAEVAYFNKHAVYPEYERNERIGGENVVTFTVMPDGTVTAPYVHRSVSPGLDAEALRLVSNMPAWKPAEKNGVKREVRCWMEIKWEVKTQ